MCWIEACGFSGKEPTSNHIMKCLLLLSLIGLFSCAPTLGPVVPQNAVERQMMGLLEKFDRWDENGDGKLTLDEMAEAEQRSGRPAEKIISFYDSNGDGGISLREAQRGFSRSGEVGLKSKL
jgi:hypothetical protein